MTILPFPHLDLPAPRAWLCHCGKRSVGVACWNCRQPRPVGEVDGAADVVYNDPASDAQGAGGDIEIAKSGDPCGSGASGKHVTRPISWAGLRTPLLQGLPTGASASGPQVGPRNGPMAFKGVFDGRS